MSRKKLSELKIAYYLEGLIKEPSAELQVARDIVVAYEEGNLWEEE